MIFYKVERARYLEITKTIRVPKELVFTWWTDLVETDSSDLKPLRNRKIISKKDDSILTDDTVKILGRTMKYSVKVTVYPPDRWEAEYSGKVANATSKYKLIEIPEGTKMLYSSEIKPNGILMKIFLPFISWIIKRIFSKEMDDYIKALEKDYQK